MQELKVIGVEGRALVAASDDGERFRIEVDEVLVSRLRQAQQPARNTAVKLTPREVQAQIRAGLSAEEVARLTGADVDDIRRFEHPVLAEREHVVNSALSVPVHVAGEFDPVDEPTTFGAAIRERLAKLGADGERWASWKDEEHGWIVKLEFSAESIDRDARWAFDQRKQTLQPVNAEAITLSQQHEPKGTLIPRLRAVAAEEPDGDSRFDSGAFALEAPDAGGHDTAPQLDPLPYSRSVSSPAATRAAIKRADEPREQMGDTADLLEALRRRRGEREAQTPEPVAEQPTLLPADVPPSTPPLERPRSGRRAQKPVPAEPTRPVGEDAPADEAKPGNAARALWGGKGVATPTPARGAKKGRASMPSWDEIVFGARTDDDLA